MTLATKSHFSHISFAVSTTVAPIFAYASSGNPAFAPQSFSTSTVCPAPTIDATSIGVQITRYSPSLMSFSTPNIISIPPVALFRALRFIRILASSVPSRYAHGNPEFSWCFPPRSNGFPLYKRQKKRESAKNARGRAKRRRCLFRRAVPQSQKPPRKAAWLSKNPGVVKGPQPLKFIPALTTCASKRMKTWRFSHFAGFAVRERSGRQNLRKLEKVAISHFFDTLSRPERRLLAHMKRKRTCPVSLRFRPQGGTPQSDPARSP